MRLPLAFLLAIAFRLAAAQTATACPADLVVTDDCTDVMNPIACYNQYRWNARTLSCIEGANDAERKRKVKDTTSSLYNVFPEQRLMLTFDVWLRLANAAAVSEL